MAEVSALPVDEVIGSMLSDDGKHLLVKFKLGSSESVLALPIAIAPNLVSAAALGVPKPEKQADGTKKVSAFSVNWWEISSVSNGDIVLSLTIPGGAVLSFRLDQMMKSGIHETLSSLLGQSISPLPGNAGQ